MIAYISYNARYVKYRGVENVSFPESGLFPRPAGLHPSVIPYDSTFAFFIFLCLICVLMLQSFFMDLQIIKLHSLPLPCALAFYFSRFSFYAAISSVVILIFLFFCARPFIKNTADDMSALWTRHRRYRSILWVFLCGSGISVSGIRIRLHCKHGSIQPDAILSRALKGFHGRG